MPACQEYFDPSHQLVRDSVRRFVEREILPDIDQWEEAESFPRELYLKAGAAGILGIGYPEVLGGSHEGDLFAKVAASEELMRCGSGGLVAGAATHQLFAGGNLGEQITFMTAAEDFGITDTENARRTGLEVELARKAFGFFPLINVRQDLALDETPDAVTDQLVAGIEVFLKGRHRRTPLKGSTTLTERLLGFQPDCVNQMDRGACIASKLAPTLDLWCSQTPCGSELAHDGVSGNTKNYKAIGLRPANECANVPPSTNSSSPPNGTPWAIREAIKPLLLSNWAM